MQLCIGDQLREVQVNLTDRTHFSYPLLIGAETIRDLNAAIYPTENTRRVSLPADAGHQLHATCAERHLSGQVVSPLRACR